jgi:hypothetical protein
MVACVCELRLGLPVCYVELLLFVSSCDPCRPVLMCVLALYLACLSHFACCSHIFVFKVRCCCFPLLYTHKRVKVFCIFLFILSLNPLIWWAKVDRGRLSSPLEVFLSMLLLECRQVLGMCTVILFS